MQRVENIVEIKVVVIREVAEAKEASKKSI
jgi:hypothetical protein